MVDRPLHALAWFVAFARAWPSVRGYVPGAACIQDPRGGVGSVWLSCCRLVRGRIQAGCTHNRAEEAAMSAREPAVGRLGRWPRPSDEAVVNAFAENLDLGREQMHRIVTQDPEQLADADLDSLGWSRAEAVELAREIRRGLAPAYRRVVASSRRPSASSGPLAAQRVGSRARGARRPAARRSRSATSSSASGDDGSGSADPEPASRPARRWALYLQSQPREGRQRAVVVALAVSSSTGRAGA